MQNELNGINVYEWISQDEIQNVEYSKFWNDEEVERKKEFFVSDDSSFERLDDYLKKVKVIDDLMLCLNNLYDRDGKNKVKLKGKGIDIACGNLWPLRHLFEHGEIDLIWCLEYSKHRLLKLGPRVIEHYNLPKDKINLAVGSFYDIKLEDESLDFVFMSQAFHHAEDPARLLKEIYRILKPNGVILMIGEHVVRESEEKPETDKVLGDHFYYIKEYETMFMEAGLRACRAKNPHSVMQSFIVYKR